MCLQFQQLWKNICSVRQERGCSEMEKLEGGLFFPRENFPFPRSDSCLAERSEGRQSRSRKRKILSRKRNFAWDFSYRRATFFSRTDTFFLVMDPWLTISKLPSYPLMDAPKTSFVDAPFYRVLKVAQASFFNWKFCFAKFSIKKRSLSDL